MELTEQLKKYDDMITNLWDKNKTILYSDSDMPITLEQAIKSYETQKRNCENINETEKKEQNETVKKEQNEAEKKEQFHSAYLDLVRYIYHDHLYQKLLSDALNNKNESLSNIMLTYKAIDINCYQDDFYLAFDSLASIWNKYEHTSAQSDSLWFSWEIFKVLYSKYPVLCQKAFPVVLFILADSYYDFCKLCYTYKNHQNLPEKISSQQEEKILSLFYERISGDYWHYYLFSLIDTKATYYSESSFNEGKKIFNSLVNDAENIKIDYEKDSDPAEIISTYKGITSIVQKKYINRLKSKNDRRKEKNSSSPIITPGENLQAFLKFLHTFTKNKWCNYDTTFTLYTLNHMSGWLNALLLCKYKDINKFLCSYYLMPELPATLFYVTTHLLKHNDTAHHGFRDSSQSSYDRQEEIFLFTNFQIHLQNSFELLDHIDDEDDFSKWYLSATEKDVSLMTNNSKKIYRNMLKYFIPNPKIDLTSIINLLYCYIDLLPQYE